MKHGADTAMRVSKFDIRTSSFREGIAFSSEKKLLAEFLEARESDLLGKVEIRRSDRGFYDPYDKKEKQDARFRPDRPCTTRRLDPRRREMSWGLGVIWCMSLDWNPTGIRSADGSRIISRN